MADARDLHRQMKIASDLSAVLGSATRVAGGDAGRARMWVYNEKLSVFDGATAAELVERGRAEDVLAFLESMEAGPAG